MNVLFNILKYCGLEAIAVLISIAAFHHSKKENKRKIKEATIHAFDILQEKLYKNNELCIWDMVYNDSDTIYEKYKENPNVIIEQLGLIEHFAVGINENIYDINMLSDMAGTRTILVWKSIEFIVQERREINNDVNCNSYKAFEDMVRKLQEIK